MIIHRIISSLQRFSKYEELFENNQLVQDAIGALYCDYLDFCVRVTRFYSSSLSRPYPLLYIAYWHSLTLNQEHFSLPSIKTSKMFPTRSNSMARMWTGRHTLHTLKRPSERQRKQR